ncbi:MAG TPA: SDR family oxidoreductase [Steroidobacteraceae bacterium]|nr:SDR family oxidoreductase [Steroidobacteraceae bacterium]
MSKIIVITGAGAGLGRALARRFAADGESVVLLGRTAAKVEKVASELGAGALAVGCDVSSPSSVRAAFATIAARHARIDVLINNAAVYEPFLVAEASDEQILKIIATNLTGPILCARAAIALMGSGAHIINVSSEVVELPFPQFSLYQSSKAGLERFSQALERELEPAGIRVSVVRAGQMMDADKTWNIDPKAAARFAQAALAAGLDLRARPISQYASVTDVFRALIDLPADLQAATIMLRARKL